MVFRIRMEFLHCKDTGKALSQFEENAVHFNTSLSSFQPNLEIELACDVSIHGIGAMLSHRILNSTEIKWICLKHSFRHGLGRFFPPLASMPWCGVMQRSVERILNISD